MRDKNKQATILEYDGANGLEVYCLPLDNALALTKIILHRVPSITLYNYDNRQNIRETHSNRGNFSANGEQSESAKDQN